MLDIEPKHLKLCVVCVVSVGILVVASAEIVVKHGSFDANCGYYDSAVEGSAKW